MMITKKDQFDWPEKVDVSIECSDGRKLSYGYYRTVLDEEDGYEYGIKDIKECN